MFTLRALLLLCLILLNILNVDAERKGYAPMHEPPFEQAFLKSGETGHQIYACIHHHPVCEQITTTEIPGKSSKKSAGCKFCNHCVYDLASKLSSTDHPSFISFFYSDDLVILLRKIIV